MSSNIFDLAKNFAKSRAPDIIENMKVCHLFTVLLVCFASFARAEEIELKSGKRLQAAVLKVSEDEIVLLQQVTKERVQTTEDGQFARPSELATINIPLGQIERIGSASPSSFSSLFSYNIGYRFASTLDAFLTAVWGKPFLTQLKIWIVFVVTMIFGIAGVLFAVGFAVPGSKLTYLSALVFVVLSGAFLLAVAKLSLALLLSWGAFGSTGLQVLASLLTIAVFGLLAQLLSRFSFIHGIVAIIVTYFAFQGLSIALSRVFNLWALA
jgi:hypothetical protein